MAKGYVVRLNRRDGFVHPYQIRASLRLAVSNNAPTPLTDPRIAELRAILAQAATRGRRKPKGKL
jgi:hypothetical protein